MLLCLISLLLWYHLTKSNQIRTEQNFGQWQWQWLNLSVPNMIWYHFRTSQVYSWTDFIQDTASSLIVNCNSILLMTSTTSQWHLNDISTTSQGKRVISMSSQQLLTCLDSIYGIFIESWIQKSILLYMILLYCHFFLSMLGFISHILRLQWHWLVIISYHITKLQL